MFDKIGKKIMGFAIFLAFGGITLSFIIGIIYAAISTDMAVKGIIIMIVGSLMSWLSSLVLYGFGKLIDNSETLVHHIVPQTDETKSV